MVDTKIDMSIFDQKLRNDMTGRPAYSDPRVLLKLILFAYSNGINSSRRTHDFEEHNVQAMAFCENEAPDFTVIAYFISGMTDAQMPAKTLAFHSYEEVVLPFENIEAIKEIVRLRNSALWSELCSLICVEYCWFSIIFYHLFQQPRIIECIHRIKDASLQYFAGAYIHYSHKIYCSSCNLDVCYVRAPYLIRISDHFIPEQVRIFSVFRCRS